MEEGNQIQQVSIEIMQALVNYLDYVYFRTNIQ